MIRNDDELVSAKPRDHASTSGALTKPVGEQLDEPIAGAVAETIVDRLQPVEVQIQQGDRSGPCCGESVGKVGDQRSTIAQTGQIVVLSEIAKEAAARTPPRPPSLPSGPTSAAADPRLS